MSSLRFRQLRRSLVCVLVVSAIAGLRLHSQERAPGVPVHMVVTTEAHHGKEVPVINRQDVMVYEGKDRMPVTDWVPLQGEQAGLELFVLLDDSSSTSLGSQLGDVRRFISSQPPTTAVAIGYMRNGTVDIVQNFTNDHAQAAKTLRLPMGNPGASPSPYLSVADLIKRWPQSQVRHEIVMVSDGIDGLGGTGPGNPYVDSAIDEAQRAGVIIYAIYATGVGHYGHSFWRINWGQNYLSQLAAETGGEAYFLGSETPVAFAPYLDDINLKLSHQYLLGFLAKPEKKAGLQRVKLRTEVPNAELVAAERVWVPAAPQ